MQDAVVRSRDVTDAVLQVDWTYEEVRWWRRSWPRMGVDGELAGDRHPRGGDRAAGVFGQVPKILEFTPGAEVTQSGLYDFNFNTRGFNSSLNRRVSTYIDGRDVGVVLLGAQEWAAISGGLDDIASWSSCAGPAPPSTAPTPAAVGEHHDQAAQDESGGMARFTGGELDTARLDVRHTADWGTGGGASSWPGSRIRGLHGQPQLRRRP
jgi:hypothetical protein